MDNICKFSISSISNDLNIYCFVRETNIELMKKEQKLRYHRMMLIEQGEGVFLFNGEPFPFSSGTLVFGLEGDTLCMQSGDSVVYLYIDFDGFRADNLYHRFGIYSSTRKKDGYNSLIPFCKDSLLSAQRENVDIAAESVLLYVFSRLSVNSTRENETIQKIIMITENNFRDPEFSISDVAEEIGYNTKYLSHLFKKNMNISYCEYLRSVRFKYAISLFELGISSVKNVALLSGFSDPLYFSNTFKKSIGISPKEFVLRCSGAVDGE